MKSAVRSFTRWLWRVAGSISVRWKILGLALGVILLLGLSLTIQMRLIQEETLRAELQRHGIALTRDLAARAAEFILLDDLYSLHNLLQDTQAHNDSVRYAFILDTLGMPLVHSFREGFPQGLLDANAVGPTDRYRVQRLETNEGVVWDIAAPVLSGEGGVARLGVSEAGLQATLAHTTRQFLLTTALVALLGMGVASVLTWMISRPIRQLVEGTEAVAAGKLDTRVSPWADDEMGALAQAFNRMTVELSRAAQERAEREQLRGLLIDKIITAQEEERRRIARELHDDTGQALTAIKMGLTNALALCRHCQERGRLDELHRLAGETLLGVRQLALELRPPVLDDLGLVAAVRRYTYDWGRTFGVSVSFEAFGLDGLRLDPAVEIAVYRIIQEALTNVGRHAQARHVGVVLERRKNECVAIVEDDGQGFDPVASRDARHLGLQGMEERAALVNGQVVIETAPGAGTTVFVRVPLQVSNAAELVLP